MKDRFRKMKSRDIAMVVTLIFFVLLIGVANFHPDEWLISDSLTYSEFGGFSLNPFNILSSILGQLAGVQASSIKMIELLSYLIVASTGVYFAFTNLLEKRKNTTTWKLSGLLAGMLYILNSLSIQLFFSPNELQLILYSLLPWIILALQKKDASRKVLISVLIVPQILVGFLSSLSFSFESQALSDIWSGYISLIIPFIIIFTPLLISIIISVIMIRFRNKRFKDLSMIYLLTILIFGTGAILNEVGLLHSGLSLLSGIMISASFCLAILSSAGIFLIIDFIHRRILGGNIMIVVLTQISLLFILALGFLPIFQGNLTATHLFIKMDDVFTEIVGEIKNSEPGSVLLISSEISQNMGDFELNKGYIKLIEKTLDREIITGGDEKYSLIISDILNSSENQLTHTLGRNNLQWVIVDLATSDPKFISQVTEIEKNLLSNSNASLIDLESDAGLLLQIDILEEVVPKFSSSEFNTEELSLKYEVGNNNILSLPAPGDLDLENAELKVSAHDSNTVLLLSNLYPEITQGDHNFSTDLIEFQIVSFKTPKNDFILVIDEKLFGPFTPGVEKRMSLSELSSVFNWEIRIYEKYDSSNAVRELKESKFVKCDDGSEDGVETKSISKGIKLNSAHNSCLKVWVPLIETTASVVLQTQFSIETTSKVALCYLNLSTNSCINSMEKTAKSSVNSIEEVGKVGPHDLALSIEIQRENLQREINASLTNLSINEYKLVQVHSSSNLWWEQSIDYSINEQLMTMHYPAKLIETDAQWDQCGINELNCWMYDLGVLPERSYILKLNESKGDICIFDPDSKLCIYRDFHSSNNQFHVLYPSGMNKNTSFQLVIHNESKPENKPEIWQIKLNNEGKFRFSSEMSGL